MSAKKGLLSRLFSTKDDSDCCQVTIVADEEDTTEARTDASAVEASDAPETSGDAADSGVQGG